MNQWDAAALVHRLMHEHGLRGWGFAFNRRKRIMGLCCFGPKRIELSIHYVASNTEASVTDTILHEIAHALCGPDAGHGARWQRKCVELGAVPKRCGDAVMPRGSWRATCPACGLEHHRHRRPMKGRTYFCRPCGATRGRLTFRRAAAVGAVLT